MISSSARDGHPTGRPQRPRRRSTRAPLLPCLLVALSSLRRGGGTTAASSASPARDAGDRGAVLREYRAGDGACVGSEKTGDADAAEGPLRLRCALYMAESSIPNAGLGAYTSVPIPVDAPLPFPSELVIQSPDFVGNFDLHRKLRGIDDDEDIPPFLMENYHWSSGNFRGRRHAASVSSVVPGLGMLSNSHPGLHNIDVRPPANDAAGLRRSRHPGAGAFTSYHDQRFASTRALPAGMELFDDYGADWFVDREGLVGKIPLTEDYERADELLSRFNAFESRMNGDGDAERRLGSDLTEGLWDLLRNGAVHSARVRNALPIDIEGMRSASETGAALHMVPNATRSIEWLERNGRCLDNIAPGPSAVDQAGRGAFATRPIEAGETITTTPLLPMSRDRLGIYFDDPVDGIKKLGEQLLLNYCYGHELSSILLFPYAPVVNFINHRSSDSSNAELRWSDMPYHKSHWTGLSGRELLQKEESGLVMDVIATRDIAPGEEVFLNYGPRWQKAWEEHLRTWKPVLRAERHVAAWELNAASGPVRTATEQKKAPYPRNVMLECYLPSDVMNATVETKGRYGEEVAWATTDVAFEDGRNWQACEVLDRNAKEDTYVARITTRDENVYTVRGLPRRAVEFVDKPYTSDELLRNAFRHPIGVPDSVFPSAWMDLGKSEDKEGACGLYMAESSIPNSGLGLYSAINITKGAPLFYPDIVIQVYDLYHHNDLRREKYNIDVTDEPLWLMNSYAWSAKYSRGNYESSYTESIMPGLGMLANSFLGLVNAQKSKTEAGDAGVHRSDDPGAGAFSIHHGSKFYAHRSVGGGDELFVDYGEQWFRDREDELGPLPLEDDYGAADELLRRFFRFEGEIADELSAAAAEDLWALARNELVDGARMRAALPSGLEDARSARDTGSAAHAVPDRTRSNDWLRENGLCVDNVRPGRSTAPHAGRGAFATRPLRRGDVVAPAPLVHFHRRHLQMYKRYDGDGGRTIEKVGEQLLLNYCYGHRESSLLFFPYSPVVNFINHAPDGMLEPNAYIRWSDAAHHQSHWADLSVDEVLEKGRVGLVLEFVASRDIAEGEEVLIDYGRGWRDAWNEHAERWRPAEGAGGYMPASALNEMDMPLLTVREQRRDPYPENVMNVCILPDDIESNVVQLPHGTEYVWFADMDVKIFGMTYWPCEILFREDENNDTASSVQPVNDEYRARVEVGEWGGEESEMRSIVVHRIPRSAIFFVDRPYTTDQAMQEAFRHEIEIPDEMFPMAWRDLA